jgi:hypothetical protein
MEKKGKEKYSDIIKEMVLDEIYNTMTPQSTIAEKFDISVSTIRRWRLEDDRKRNPPSRKYYKRLAIFGAVLLVPAFILIRADHVIPTLILFFLVTVFQIPHSYYIFIVDMKNKNYRPFSESIRNFAEPIIVAFVLFVGIIMLLNRHLLA